ncbi:ZmpA/ZmpB/ZmpC family metallo-endopeptidase [Streptococcus suis]|uniref:ZmpA/ZmpB/ZmpC family metallo-endopeptidase n=1 Tax=Streptococcus suis TaxID=1307 RepID=UPI001EE94FE6|nr:ZmpA/ZmpB/ZmpC family metallo-endopeptidase [Streptococcus suis]MBS8101171.1 YSIRK-type signal peptide-containing protein [Streptococcus suis]
MNLHFLQKKHHFGIRKFSIGVVSVALAISFSVLGGQVAAAQEATQAAVSSQQTSQPVTDEPSQQQETNEVAVQTPETLGSLLNEATQENLAQESQLVEVEPAIQREAVSQDISAPQAALPAEEQSNPAGDENILPAENFHQVAEPVEPDPIQTKQEPAGSTDEATQPVQPTETAAGEAASTDQAVEEVVQPVLRSARRARSVVVTEVAKLPLDAQGQLMTSVSGATVHKFQVINSDGSSQIVEAQATDQIQKTSDISDKVNQIKQELSAITYESLYPSLNNYERIYDKTDMDGIIAKENPGRTFTEAEKVVLRNKYYMDQLDMRDSFTRVQGDLEHILTGLFEKSNQVDIETIKTNKEKVLLGLTYLDRQFSFKFGNYQAKDLILYHPEVFGGTGDVLTNLYTIGSQNYQDLLLAQSATTFKNKVARQLGQTDVFSFVEKGLSIFDKDKTDSEWLKEESKALIVEAANSYGPTTTLYEKFKSDTRLANHLLPLLSLPSESVYVLSTSNTVSYGLTETYLGQAPATADFKQKLSDYAYHQQEFLNFWHRMTQRKQEFANHPPIIVVDTVQKYGQPGNARDLYSPKFGSTVLKGVREFIAPLNLYANFVFAGGQASGTSRMNNFLYKLLTNDGHEVYTHELTHMLDKTIWLNGYGRRSGQLQEVFARGLFESRNMSAATVSDPIFNLNTAYTISGARTQNSHPNRFQTTEDMKTYMQGILDVIYTLDYAEAEAILKQTADDRAVLLNQIRLVPDTTNTRGGMTEEVLPIDASTAANLQTVADFVDQGMISGRYKLNGMATRGVAKTNQYHTIPLFEPIYAALQNDTGSGGDISFKRNAYEILGEYGYENGMVAYLSDKHANDQAALNAIMPEYNGNLVTFKKAMFDRRIAKVSQLKSTSEASDFAAIQSEMDKAIAKDLQQLKANANNNVLLSTGVNAVRDLKNKIFQAYLQATDEFRTSIYSEPKVRELYVTNGAENSTDGQGTETNPYQSLSYALSQAKDGDTIKLVSDILHRDGQNFVTNFVIDKAVTIDGRGNKLNLRGLNLLTTKDVTLTNLKLEMIPDGGQQPKIYADGNHLPFDNVSTTISQAQTDLRPILIAGSLTDNPSGSHARISIIGGSSETRFHQIFAGNAQGTSLIPVDIVIDSEFAKVDQGIDLGSVDGSQTIDRVTLESNSSNIKKVVATNSSDNHVTLKAARIFGVELADVQELTLRERADITLSDKVSSITTRLELGTGSLLNLAINQNLEIGELTGDGKLIIPASSSLQVTGDIQGSVQVLVRGFEQNLAQNVNKEYVTVDGGVTPSASISLENDFNRFVLSKEGTIYRLTEPTQTPQNLQINLRFKEGETVVKEESLTLQVGSSVTDLVARLPQPAQGHYEIASSFDRTQLNNLQISQTVEIPLELITPTLPVKVFDKTAVTGLELVTPPTKTDYRPAETVELAGLQVKLVDNQGLSKTITPDQFKEYGVEVVPVTLTPQVTSLQLRKDTHEVAIPIQVTPWKADVYSVTVGDKYVYETDGDLTAVGTAILAKVQVDAQAGPVERSLVNPLLTTLGEHTIPVLVRFDDGSQEQVFVQVIVQKTENGKGVKHELPVGVLPKSDLYQAQVTGSAQALPTSTSEATMAEILKQISLPTAVGQVDFEVVGSLPQSSGDYSITVRVVYDDRSQEEVAVPLHILFVENGKGVKHELPEGVLPKSDLYQAQVTGTAQVLPTSTSEATTAEILKQISLPTAAGQVYFEVIGSLPHSSGNYSITVRVVYDDRSQEEVAVPLHILFVENGKGVKHELPEGVLPKSDLYQAQVTGTAQVLPTSTSEATTAEILKQISLPTAAGQVDFEVVGSLPHSSGDYSIIVRVVYDDRSQEEVAVPLHILFVENGKGVKHELPVGVLPPLEVAKGTFVVSEKGTGENSPKPAAKEMAVPVSAVEQKQLSNRQLPETGDKNDLVLVGLMLALFNLVFLKHGKKSHHSLYRGDEK